MERPMQATHVVTMTSERVAVPLFGDEVAPRFCFADVFLVADVVGHAVGSTHRLAVGDVPGPQRLGQLGAAQVAVLLCGGFNRRFQPLAARYGIEVIWGLCGRADPILQAYADGELDRFRLTRPGRWGRSGWDGVDRPGRSRGGGPGCGGGGRGRGARRRRRGKE